MKYDGPILKEKYFYIPFMEADKKRGTGGVMRVTLISISDGDTAVFLVDGKEEHVRLFCIDTPEYNRFGQAPWGKQAKDYLITVLHEAQVIYLQSDPYDFLRDNTSFERLLAWVWIDGELLNYNLVKRGYADLKYVHSNKMLYVKELRRALKYAKKKKLKINGEKDSLWTYK